jgi:hypothetical protein
VNEIAVAHVVNLEDGVRVISVELWRRARVFNGSVPAV